MAFSQVFQTAVNAILPIVLLILLGYGLRQRGFLTEAFLKNGNRLTFRVLLPVTLFINVGLEMESPMRRMGRME